MTALAIRTRAGSPACASAATASETCSLIISQYCAGESVTSSTLTSHSATSTSPAAWYRALDGAIRDDPSRYPAARATWLHVTARGLRLELGLGLVGLPRQAEVARPAREPHVEHDRHADAEHHVQRDEIAAAPAAQPFHRSHDDV